jgi:GntR family transcriptional regulator
MTDPLYLEIADQLRKRITAGEFPDGHLPSERVLADQLSVSRTTTRAAMEALRAEGLIEGRQGAGYTIRDRQPIRWIASEPERNVELDVSPSDAWSRNIRAQGFTPDERITVEVAAADPYVAGCLEVPVGTDIVIRRRLRTVDGKPFMTADSYYLHADVHDTPIARSGDVLPGVYAIFEQMGRPWSPAKVDRIGARMPRRFEMALLNISAGTPVMTIGRVSRDIHNVPVRLTIYVVPGDRSESEYHYREDED